jgi:sec-independent protein translocase protein TatB
MDVCRASIRGRRNPQSGKSIAVSIEMRPRPADAGLRILRPLVCQSLDSPARQTQIVRSDTRRDRSLFIRCSPCPRGFSIPDPVTFSVFGRPASALFFSEAAACVYPIREWAVYHNHMGVDMIFIFLLALILFGPKRLPEIAREVGKFMAEFKRASNDFKYQLQAEIDKAGAPAPPQPQATQQSLSSAPVLLPPAVPMSGTSLSATQTPSEAESEHERLMRTARMAFDAQNFSLRPPEPPPVAHVEPQPADSSKEESSTASAESNTAPSPSSSSPASAAEAVGAPPGSGSASPAGNSAPQSS